MGLYPLMTKVRAHPVSQDRAFAASPSSPSVSPVPASIPCAAEDRILRAVKRALEQLNSPGLTWQEYYRKIQQTPDLALHELRECGVLFRLPEQADWPLLIEAFSTRPYTLTIRTQMTIGGQTFGFDQQNDYRLLYNRPPMDRDLAAHLGRHAIRATLEAVAEPYFQEAALQIASAIEARRAETHSGSVADESAVGNAETPNPCGDSSHD